MSRRHDGRPLSGHRLLRFTALAAGASAAAPVLTAASLMAFNWFTEQGRRNRRALSPGTFHTRLSDTDLSVYTAGTELYDDMIEAIDSAERTIQLEAFIWKADEVGQRFMDSLNAAAERGVEVFVLYDGFANLVVPRSFYRQFSEKVRVLRLPIVRRRFWKGLLRHTGVNHSKTLVVDDRIGFVGGYNLGSRYADHWRDTHVRQVGPGVWGLQHSFAHFWNELHDDPRDQVPWIPPHTWDPDVVVKANLPVQLIYPIRQIYLSAIGRAQRHIWITTPYFIPDQQILQALISASRRGVDVRVMVPRESNHIVADWVSRGFYGELLDAGITIQLYATSMIHAKVATIDGEWSTVGTANIDRLSLSYNYETNIEIVDPRFAAVMERIFDADSEHCEFLRSPAWRDRNPLARAVEFALVPLRPLL